MRSARCAALPISRSSARRQRRSPRTTPPGSASTTSPRSDHGPRRLSVVEQRYRAVLEVLAPPRPASGLSVLGQPCKGRCTLVCLDVGVVVVGRKLGSDVRDTVG